MRQHWGAKIKILLLFYHIGQVLYQEGEKMQKNYYAIIPANVRYDSELTPNAKLLYGEITALCNEKGYCWATNSYFSELYKVSKTSVSTWVNQLINKGYINSEIQYKEGSKEILHRYLRISNYPIQENLNTPIKENLKDNNTSFNNTSNNTTTTENPVRFFESNLGLLSPIQMQEIWDWVDDYNGQSEIIIEAMKIALDRNKKNMGFVKYLLKDWKDKGAKTLSDIQALQTEWNGKGGKHFESARGNFKGIKPESRNYDDEISRREKERPSFIKSI